MVTKNFYMVEEYELFSEAFRKKIIEEIRKIEEYISTDLSLVGNKIRTATENILFEEFNLEGTLFEKINKLRESIYIPTSVSNALHTIRIKGNSESHGFINKSNRIYRLNYSIEDAIIGFRSLWNILRFIVKNKRGDNEEIQEFSSQLYRKKINIEELKVKEVENDNKDVTAEYMSISQLIMLKKYSFAIPTYQRDYAWTEENVITLLNDIDCRTQDTQTHYFGALAVASDASRKLLRIIDGQQRITTSLILLKVFYDIYTSKKMELPRELEEFMNIKMKNIYKSKKILDSQKAVDRVLNGNIKSGAHSITSTSAYKNYNKIKEWLESKNRIDIESAYGVFVAKFSVATLWFSTTVDKEMDIFENLNTKGTILKAWDLTKNYMFTRLDIDLFDKKEDDINQYIIDNFQTSLNLDSSKKISDKLGTFFTLYNRWSSVVHENKVLKSRENYLDFKKLWPHKNGKYSDYDEYIIELDKIKQIFNIYRELDGEYKNNESVLYKYSHILNFIIKDDILPLLINEILKCGDFSNDYQLKKIVGKSFYKLISNIQSYFIRLSVVGGFGNSQAKDFDNFLLKNLHNKKGVDQKFWEYASKNITPKMPAFEEFQSVLSRSGNLKNGAIINMLINIEMKLQNINIESTNYTRFEKTHEHILAIKLELKNYDDDVNEEAFESLKNRWMNSIGNALILSKGENSRAGNKPFMKKVSVYKNSNSYLPRGKTHELMNLTTKIQFTFKDVEERSLQLSKLITPIYEKRKE